MKRMRSKVKEDYVTELKVLVEGQYDIIRGMQDQLNELHSQMKMQMQIHVQTMMQMEEVLNQQRQYRELLDRGLRERDE